MKCQNEKKCYKKYLIVHNKKGGTTTQLTIVKNGTIYTSNKIVTEEGNYQIKVTTEAGEETVDVIVDLENPVIEYSFDTEIDTINMTVTDNGSGIAKIKEESQQIIDITWGYYLRGYKIIATDLDGNSTTVENTFNPPIQRYIIMTEAQLKSFRDQANSGVDFANKTVCLGADIELNKGKYTLDETGKRPTFSADAEQWTPIKFTETSLGFTFDGRGHYISGVYIEYTVEYGKTGYAGLFHGNNSYAVPNVKNLGVVDAFYHLKGESRASCVIGGITADGNGNIISNCYFRGIMISSNMQYTTYMTGIGSGMGRSKIVDCTFDGIIKKN